MGSCKSSLADKHRGKSIVVKNGVRKDLLTLKEKKFLSLLFNELCVRNNSKNLLEKNIFLLVFKLKGLLGEELFDKSDFDKDGYLNIETFLEIVSNYTSGDLETISSNLFKICDLDSDGQISKKEFLITVIKTQLGPTLIESFDHMSSFRTHMKLRKTDSNFAITCPSETQTDFTQQKENFPNLMTLPMSFPLSQNDFTEFLFREKQVFELITNKFLYKNWKESQNYLIYKPSQSTQAKITFKGKLCNKILSLTEHFLMIFHESKGLELVILLQDFCVKVKNAEMSLFYFSKIGERLNFLFESAEICENFAKNLKKIRSFKDFYQIEKKIGSGKFSDVFLATEKNTGISFAVKIIRKRKMNRSEREMIRKEIEILGNLRHPGILCLKEVFESRKSVKIVAEYVIGVELIEIMKTRPADERLARVLIKKILETLKFLHYSAVIHRDIKPENILVVNQDSEVQIKIIDYGLSTYFKPNELKKLKCGTLGYTAPEMLSGEYNEKVDVWSVGVVCFAFFTGKLPFFSYSLDEVVEMTKFKDPSFDFEDWKMFSKESRDFCFELLNKNPSERMSCEEALSHPWLQEDL